MGTGNYPAGSDLPSIPSVTGTLVDLGRALVEQCGLATENLRLVVDPQTPSEMGNALAEQAEQAEGVLLVYYVGHGLVSPSGELYLANGATDRRPTRLGTTALSYAQVRNCLLESRAQSIVVVLDCCFSGRAIGALGDPEAEAAAFAHVSGGFVLTSAARNEVALAPPGARHTAFTGELIRLLTEGDSQGSHELTLRDTYRYLNRVLPARHLPRPHRQASEGADDLVLAPNPAWQSSTVDPTPPVELVSRDGGAANVCPYPGLAAFGPNQAQWFFGRERATAELVGRLTERLDGTGPLVVVAPSGTGKSSLLRAGLLPALGRGVFPAPGSRSWPTLLFTPTAHPGRELVAQVAGLVGTDPRMLYEELASEPARLADILRGMLAAEGQSSGAARLVVVVDQFEETFTLCADEHQRQVFIRALCAAATSADGRSAPALVVLGLRADFYGRCAAYPELVTSLRHGQVLLGAMTIAELRDAIEKPANAIGLTLQAGLVEVLLRDLGADDTAVPGAIYDPGRLPLLSHALLATWQQRQDNTLTLHGYQLTGGIRGAIATTAEYTYQYLGGGGQHTAHQLLLRMIEIGEGVEDTRRRVDRNRLVAESTDPATAQAVLDALAHARLVTLDETTAEITHEALLRAWPRLREWIDTDRAGLLIRQQLTDVADVWHREGHHPSLLYQGPRLATARGWADTAGPRADLTPLARQFLAVSVQREHDEQRAIRRRTRRLGQLVAALAVLLLVATTATIDAFRKQETVREQRDIALSQKVAKNATELRATNPALAAQLSLAAYRLKPTSEAEGSLLSTFATPFATRLTGHDGAVNSVAISPDGHTLATGAADNMIRVWDIANTRDPTSQGILTTHSDVVNSVVFSPDGRTLAAGGGDGTVRVLDLLQRKEVAAFTGHSTHPVHSVVFSPDGRTLAAGGGDGTVRVLDLLQRKEVAAFVAHSTHPVYSVAFSPDGNTLATGGGDGTARIWDITNPRPLSPLSPLGTAAGHIGKVSSVAFSFDGHMLATGGADHRAQLWDITNPQQPSPLGNSLSHNTPVSAMAFSPDGHTLATGSDDDFTSWLWDVTNPRQANHLVTLRGHTNQVSSVAFSRDGRTLATGSADGTARLWDISGPALTDHSNTVTSVAFSPDGRTLATGSADNNARLWDITNPSRPRTILTGYTNAVVAFSPADELLAIGSADGRARLWDVRQGKELAVLPGHTGKVYSVVFSPDGRTLATGSGDKTVQLWDVTNPQQTRQLVTLRRHTDEISSVAFSLDGRTLATSSADKTVRLWGVADRRRPRDLAPLTGYTNLVSSVAFSSDGRTLATGSADNKVRIWDITNPQQPSQLATLSGHTNTVYWVAFSPDGRTLATSSVDTTVRLWDVADRRWPQDLATLTGHTETVLSVAFSPDGHTLATGSVDKTARLWETDVDRVAQRICDVAHPRISTSEWEQYFPDLTYQLPC